MIFPDLIFHFLFSFEFSFIFFLSSFPVHQLGQEIGGRKKRGEEKENSKEKKGKKERSGRSGFFFRFLVYWFCKEDKGKNQTRKRKKRNRPAGSPSRVNLSRSRDRETSCFLACVPGQALCFLSLSSLPTNNDLIF